MNKNQKLELTWIGKDNQTKLEPRILIEDPEKFYGDKNSENMLIYGDNLLALKALEQDFAGQIKCACIDPPYNTGNAFEHYDDGLEHSIWLSLMKPRIEILHRHMAGSGLQPEPLVSIMPSIRISKEFASGIYYLTFTVRNWYYLFDRHNRFQILADSLQYYQMYKGLKLYAYVFMLNHIHIIAFAPDMIAFVRDFKKFTSKEMQNNIIATEPNVLKLFDMENGKYEF